MRCRPEKWRARSSSTSRALVAAALAVGVTACNTEPPVRTNGFPGVRVLRKGETATYEVKLGQTRHTTGLGNGPDLRSDLVATIVEEALDDDRYSVLVRKVDAIGEDRQKEAAQRLVGRRYVVNLGAGTLDGLSFAGTDDVAAADLILLFQLAAPILPRHDAKRGDTWSGSAQHFLVGWSDGGVSMSPAHTLDKRRTERGLPVATVRTEAVGSTSFRIDLVQPAPSAPAPNAAPASSKPQPYIVDQLFRELFALSELGVGGVIAASIAAIPLAIAAPFLAIGEAIGRAFGGRRSTSSQPSAPPPPPALDLAGPLRLETTTDVYTRTGQILGANGTGHLELAGHMPELGGKAATLSGRPMTLDADWTYARTLTSRWPKPPVRRAPLPAIAAAIAFLVSIAAAWWARRGRVPAAIVRPALPASTEVAARP